MKTRFRCFAGAIAAAVALFVAAQAGAETATLKLKRLEPTGRPGVVYSGSNLDHIYRMTYPQHFYLRIREGSTGVTSSAEANFSRVIKKEPEKYQSKHPFRAVAKLGGKDYGLVLDAKDAESKGYDRLLFDFNGNGDLTDDKAVDALEAKGRGPTSSSYRYHYFPRVDLTLDLDGEKLDYSFFLSVYSRTTTKSGYASASLNAAAYREGEITLDGKTRRVVLLDYNSNGRFNDQFTVRGSTSSGVIYPQQGDILLVDPDPTVSSRSYDVIADPAKQLLSKLASIDGRFYDLEVSAAGEKLTMEPSSVPVGHVTSPNKGFRAVMYGEQGFLKVAGGKDKPIALPEGEWKLISYTIDQTGYKEPPAKPAEKKEKKEEKKRSLLQALAGALVGGSTTASKTSRVVSGPRTTLVSARATGECKAVKVAKGQTVALPFGPPYKPIVTASSRGTTKTVYLGLSLVGSGGERCSDMRVNGGRPPKPEFTISTPDGKEVQTGNFEYG